MSSNVLLTVVNFLSLFIVAMGGDYVSVELAAKVPIVHPQMMHE
jgi:hypothetical protein